MHKRLHLAVESKDGRKAKVQKPWRRQAVWTPRRAEKETQGYQVLVIQGPGNGTQKKGTS